MSSTTITRIFDAPIDVVFKAVSDYEAFPSFLDGANHVKVLQMDAAKGGRVEFSISVIKEFTYVLKMKHQPPGNLSWSFESGDLFKKNEGSWQLKDLGSGRTEAVYTLDVEFKMMVPKMILNKLVSSNLPLMMDQYHEHAKKLKGKKA